MSRESAAERLARMRRRLTVTFGSVALVGIGALALLTTIVDGRLRADRFQTELQGTAFRTAALVYFDDTLGEWVVDGVVDDLVSEVSDGIVVVDRASGSTLLATAPIEGLDPLLVRIYADVEEHGSSGDVAIGGRSVPAAGAPYFDTESERAPADLTTDDVAGAVVVAGHREDDPDRRRLLAFVWSAAAALTALSAVVAWLIAGRVVRPLAAELDREEAFLATTAHELRTPLGRLRAVTESALMTTRELPESPGRAALAGDLRRLLQLNVETTRSVEDLLLLGRMEAGGLTARRERVRIDQVVAAFEATTPELAVETTGPVEVVGDPTLIRHAVSNVIGNAQQHARRPEVGLVIEASVAVEGDEAVVLVRDNGPGLGDSPTACFERHHSTGSTGGLGLWIVRNIVEELGGTVTARNGVEGAELELRWKRAPSP